MTGVQTCALPIWNWGRESSSKCRGDFCTLLYLASHFNIPLMSLNRAFPSDDGHIPFFSSLFLPPGSTKADSLHCILLSL